WWNSGIFIVRASVWLKAIRELEPAIYAACEQAVAQLCESVVVPLDAGWSDVGSWDAIWQISPKDEAENVGRGHVLFEGAEST
ncbi:sugar phosphate nucleotidyltransferase, partial [Stenotrophomonas maltophilia]|uniref:sugar phosphate nucleotidyltransferase n=1 Tax=Stenotrophomonas maltophilia TaxID=40324 RepID=UPI0023B861DF